MESKEFQLIPNEIIEAWIRGEYYSDTSPKNWSDLNVRIGPPKAVTF